MTWRSRRSAWIAAPLCCLALGARVGEAQGWRETELWAVGVGSRPVFAGAGAGYGWRDRRRTRLAASLALGAAGGDGPSVRGELVAHFLLDPGKRSGSAVYGGGGLAVGVSPDGEVRPYLLVTLGAENSPGGRAGSFIELGFGGGARLAVGMRWRKQNAPSR